MDDDESPFIHSNNDQNNNSQQELHKRTNSLADQDKQLEAVLGITQSLKGEGKNINSEVKLHNVMSGKLETEMETVNQRMVKVDNRLKRIISQSNQRGLYAVLIVEILCFLFTVFIL